MEDLKTNKNNTNDYKPDLNDGEKFLKASNQYSTVENIIEQWFILRFVYKKKTLCVW